MEVHYEILFCKNDAVIMTALRDARGAEGPESPSKYPFVYAEAKKALRKECTMSREIILYRHVIDSVLVENSLVHESTILIIFSSYVGFVPDRM